MRVQRLEAIAAYIQKEGSVSIQQLCEEFQVSVNTIRRDLDALVQEGAVKKVYGGVVAAGRTEDASTPLTRELMDFQVRNRECLNEKQKIGRKAAEFVQHGDTIFLDSGSTTLQMIPYLAEKKIDYFNRTANQILNALVVIVVPAMVGLIALSKNIVFIIAGQEYVDANISLKILSVALLFSIFSWFYTSCILIPYRCENKVLMATIVAALVNIGLNFILIPTFQQNAAAFTTVIAELLSMVITWWYGRKYFRVSFLKKDILSVAIGCLAIWTICSISEKYISSVLISTVFSVTASVVIYMIVLLIMKNQAVKLVLEILHIKK